MDVSWVFMTLALSGSPQAPAPVVTPPARVIRADFDQQLGGPQQQGERAAPPDERPHQMGIGPALTAGSGGAGAAMRMFFNDRIGVDFMAGWASPRTYNTTGSTFYATPSFHLMLKRSNDLASVDIRPYVGGGFNYVRSSYRPVNTPYTEATSGIGGQVYGGAEITFQAAQWVTISAEGRYYSLPVRTVNANMIDGMNFVMMFHFYFADQTSLTRCQR
jgi:hypothetical protein